MGITLTVSVASIYIKHQRSKHQEPDKIYKYTPIDRQVHVVNDKVNDKNEIQDSRKNTGTPEKSDESIQVVSKQTPSKKIDMNNDSNDESIGVSVKPNQDGTQVNPSNTNKPTVITADTLPPKPESLLRFEEMMRKSKGTYTYIPTLADFRKKLREMEKDPKPGMEGAIDGMRRILADMEKHGVKDIQ